MINLEHKKVLLTGASGGIGKAIANELASLGADICLTGRNEEELIKLKNELDMGDNVKINEVADLLYTELDTLKDKIVKRFCKDDESTISSTQLKELIVETREGFCADFDTTSKNLKDILQENGININFDPEAIVNMAAGSITQRGPADPEEKNTE